MLLERALRAKILARVVPTSRRSDGMRTGQTSYLSGRHLHRNAPNPLPASFLRGGTSKGIFIDRVHLPQDPAHWDPIFLGIMGSPDPVHGRQLNGMGGGVSSLSKICVVEKPSESQKAQGINIVYTFVQVGIRDTAIDYSGNCGNLSSMIGVFAMDEGMCTPRTVDKELGLATIRSLNTNTDKIIDTTFPIASLEDSLTPLLDLPQVSMAGVPGKASQIVMEFVSPGGARTGKLLPTGRPVDQVEVTIRNKPTQLRVSLVDATNPTVFINGSELAAAFYNKRDSLVDYSDVEIRRTMKAIRRRGAELMGLDPSAKAQPKIAALSPPGTEDIDVDIVIHAFSMGVLHKAVPMTVGLCLGVASQIKGTLAWEIADKARSSRSLPSSEIVRMRHPGGTVDVGASMDANGNAESAKVVRTGRRLMKGVVWW